jgi:rfaE bifunctional protein nucleotidyltransferase chain/domain
MVGKIIKAQDSIKVAKKLHAQGSRIVLVGGCFDILHVGHLSFLEKAKEQGNTLIVLLENDSRIKKIKGLNRPINSQLNRATLLAALSIVDYVVTLPDHMTNELYDELILDIKPAIIATTQQDPNRIHKERQAKIVHGRVVDVVPKIENASTSRIAELLKNEM